MIAPILGPDGTPLVLLTTTIAAFSSEPLFVNAERVKNIFDKFLTGIPSGTIKYVIPTAFSEEWRSYNSTWKEKIRNSLSTEGTRTRKITAFHINDSGASAASVGFSLEGRPNGNDFPDASTLLQITLPYPQEPDERWAKQITDAFLAFVDEFSPDYAYCSPSFSYSELHKGEAFWQIRKLSNRFLGVDVQINDLTRLWIGHRTRGARWLTALNKELFDQVMDLNTNDISSITIKSLSNATVLIASKMPQLVDIKRKQKSAGLSQMAQLLEPITYFDEIDLLSHYAAFQESILRKWERRFLK